MCSAASFWFFFSSRRRHTRFDCDWSSDVCSSDLLSQKGESAMSLPIYRLLFLCWPISMVCPWRILNGLPPLLLTNYLVSLRLNRKGRLLMPSEIHYT